MLSYPQEVTVEMTEDATAQCPRCLDLRLPPHFTLQVVLPNRPNNWVHFRSQS